MSSLFLLAFALPVHAGDEWTLLFTPRSLRPSIAFEIPGAQETTLVPARLRNGEPEPVTRATYEAAGLQRDVVETSTRALAENRLEQLKPNYFRNKQGVLEYAVIQSTDPLTSSLVFAPGFLPLFARTLGPKVLVAVPNRYTIYVFPQLASDYRDYTETILRLYNGATVPGSRELFELGPDGLRAVGIYAEP